MRPLARGSIHLKVHGTRTPVANSAMTFWKVSQRLTDETASQKATLYHYRTPCSPALEWEWNTRMGWTSAATIPRTGSWVLTPPSLCVTTTAVSKAPELKTAAVAPLAARREGASVRMDITVPICTSTWCTRTQAAEEGATWSLVTWSHSPAHSRKKPNTLPAFCRSMEEWNKNLIFRWTDSIKIPFLSIIFFARYIASSTAYPFCMCTCINHFV